MPNLSKLKQNQLRMNQTAENNGWYGIEILKKVVGMGWKLRQSDWHGIKTQRKAAGIESRIKQKQLTSNQNSRKYRLGSNQNSRTRQNRALEGGLYSIPVITDFE